MDVFEYFEIITYPEVDYYGFGYSTEIITDDDWPNSYKFGNTSDRIVYQFSGLGMPEYAYTTSRTPYHDGVHLESVRAEPRRIQITLLTNGCSREEYWAERSRLIDALRPNYHRPAYEANSIDWARNDLIRWMGYGPGTIGPNQLIIYLANGQQFAYNVRYADGAVFSPRDIDEWNEFGFEETIELIAHDPFAYNPTVVQQTFENPSALNPQFLSYYGTANSYPVIEVFNGGNANVTPGSLWSTEDRVKIEIASPYQPISIAYCPPDDHIMVIGLEPGKKGVALVPRIAGQWPAEPDLNEIVTDITGYLDLEDGPGFAEFSLGPYWSRNQVSAPDKHLNKLAFARGGVTGLWYRFRFYERYVGI